MRGINLNLRKYGLGLISLSLLISLLVACNNAPTPTTEPTATKGAAKPTPTKTIVAEATASPVVLTAATARPTSPPPITTNPNSTPVVNSSGDNFASPFGTTRPQTAPQTQSV